MTCVAVMDIGAPAMQSLINECQRVLDRYETFIKPNA